MMELSHSLTLNEEALNQLPESKRPVFVFEWLRFLDKVLIAAQKNDIKGCQKKLVEQLTQHIQQCPGPPTRRLVARCLATLFSVGDTFLLFDTVNKCNDILRNKDDSPSFLPTKLAAICCIGAMYEKLGRMMGRSYEETVQILIKCLRNAESQTRIEIMITLEKVCCGMGSAIANMHKEIYKAARHCLTDRVMAVRCAASKCILEMLNHASFLPTTELENLATLCFRAFDGSNYEVRCSVSKLLGGLIAITQQQPPKVNQTVAQNKAAKPVSLEEALTVLMSGFLRGGVGFLKNTGEIIKGSSGLNREVRVGVTHSYVVFIQLMGGAWLERNLTAVLSHVLDLVANPKAAASHVDAVYARKCVNFILRSVLGRMLGEKAQIAAVKEMTLLVAKQMTSIDFSPENAKDCNQETLFGQHLLVCALQEMACLIQSLGTTASNLLTSSNLVDAVLAVLVHPCQAARLAAAWCLRCICVAVPSQNTPVIDRCEENIENMRSSPEAIAGYSAALAAVLGGVKLSPLGVPHTKGKVIFNTAEELLRSASQNSRLSLNRTQSGWLLIGAIMALGVPVVRGLLPRMLLLWRNSFPRSNKELESEKARGDAFTWQVTLEGRAGALAAMHSFLQYCPELLTDDIIRRLLTPIEAALAMLINISSVLKNYGQHLKAPAAMVRLRLYETLSLLPPQSFEGSYTHLLRLLVAEFTLSENSANTTTSQLRLACHTDDSVILGSWLQETDHRTIEEQLQPNSAAGSGALEHDACCLFRIVPQGERIPGPLPLGVAVIDSSVVLFGCVFPRVANKHRLQMMDHFSECMKAAKSCRADAVTLNVFAALLSGLKGLTDNKAAIGQDDVKKNATALIIGVLTSSSAMLRCAAAECLGRLAQVVGDPRFTAELAQTSFDRLKLARDVASRTGHSLALGCLHRHVGSMGSSQHLNTSVSILLALAQDLSSPVVQVWALHALALIAESGGPMLRGYVEPTLSLALKLLLNVSQSHVDVHQCIGKLVSALITTVGPELQGNTASVCMARGSFLCACAIMQDHQEPLVQAEATSCLQQLHLFAPRHVNLSSLVPTLCRTLTSNHLLLRKAAVSCLRQLTQREAKEVCEHALTLSGEARDSDSVDGLVITETGLPGLLFSMLDTETDSRLIKDIHDTLTSMLQVLAADNLSQWLSMCKVVLTVASDTNSTGEGDMLSVGAGGLEEGEEEEEEGDDDNAEFTMGENSSRPVIQPRWPTRVFAAECVRRIVAACQASRDTPAHFDLALAKEMQLTKSRGDYLVLHLSELVRMAFMAATSDCDPLRLEGLRTLHQIIDTFNKVPEPEFPGHLLLEQFQAQVGAALRPAFAAETASHVTAAACQVCSAWIGSGVARDLNDLRRVHHLLVSSLAKLQRVTDSPYIYNESLATLERLSILKAWAETYPSSVFRERAACTQHLVRLFLVQHFGEEVYIVAMTGSECNSVAAATVDSEPETRGESLLTLVQPELVRLSGHWLAALKDHALLSLPPEFASQLPHDGGAFYTTDTMESCRQHYAATWPPLLHAAALWLNANNFHVDDDNQSPTNRFHLLFGICMEALCSPRMSEPSPNKVICLKALYTLFEGSEPSRMLMENKSLAIELCNVLHRQLLMTSESVETQQLVMDVLKQVLNAAQAHTDKNKKKMLREMVPANQEGSAQQEVELLGEGGDNGELPPESSLVFAALEVCLCMVISELPELSPSPPVASVTRCPDPDGVLLTSALATLEQLPRLCSPLGAVTILPTLLYLVTGVLKECGVRRGRGGGAVGTMAGPVKAALHCLRSLASDKHCQDPRSATQWKTLLQSALAKILDLTKTGSDVEDGEEAGAGRVDDTVMMTAVSVFVLHAPPEVTLAPNLKYPCINHMMQCAQSSDIQVQIKCMQTFRSILSGGALSVVAGYIHAMAPGVLQYLHGVEARNPTTDAQLTLTVESLGVVDTLVRLADPQHRIQMLNMLVPILVDYLAESPSTTCKQSLALHEHCLQMLKQIGPQYPQEFKTIMAQSTNLRTRLESAIRNSQTLKQPQASQRIAVQKSTSITPTIKLKTDFRNFTS